MLSAFGRREWITIAVIGLMVMVTLLVVGWWLAAVVVLLATTAALGFFRDPERQIPTQRGIMVSPADGRITSIHQVDHFDPFEESAVCIRIFLSILNVHVNRSPCHAMIESTLHHHGQHLSALNPKSAEVNEWNLIVMRHPTHGGPLAAVRQVAGQLARTIICGVNSKQIVQRGQRIGMIILGSTTELYLPASVQPQVTVEKGQKVYGGLTVLANIRTIQPSDGVRAIRTISR